ncbi:MAG: phospholipase [Rhizobiales bacterium]|nr:phospholipase [Hyphomicrobiales bacterium]
MRRLAAPADLSPKQFRDALVDNGFAYLGRTVDRYVDIRSPRPGRLFEPVVNAKRQTLRRETLAALLAGRNEVAEAQRLIREANDRRLAAAAAIAPVALPTCRADLTDTAAIAQLADDFLTRIASAGSVDFKGLIQMGWRPEQLRQHADAARAVADRRAVPA